MKYGFFRFTRSSFARAPSGSDLSIESGKSTGTRLPPTASLSCCHADFDGHAASLGRHRLTVGAAALSPRGTSVRSAAAPVAFKKLLLFIHLPLGSLCANPDITVSKPTLLSQQGRYRGRSLQDRLIFLGFGLRSGDRECGSRFCSKSVDPLMSAKSAVTVLRSPSRFPVTILSVTRIDESFGFFGDAAADGLSDVPHSSQNLAPGLFLAPHFGHEASMGPAHSLQNLAPSRFSAPHFAHFIVRRSIHSGAPWRPSERRCRSPW